MKRKALIEFGVAGGRLVLLAIWHSYGRRVSVGVTQGDYSDRAEVEGLIGLVGRTVLDSEGLGVDDVSVNEWKDAKALADKLQVACPDQPETKRIADLVRRVTGSDAA